MCGVLDIHLTPPPEVTKMQVRIFTNFTSLYTFHLKKKLFFDVYLKFIKTVTMSEIKHENKGEIEVQ